MDYYLKKQKFLCIIVCVFQALSFTMNACIQFLLMKIFDSAAQMNFNLVLFWMGIISFVFCFSGSYTGKSNLGFEQRCAQEYL